MGRRARRRCAGLRGERDLIAKLTVAVPRELQPVIVDSGLTPVSFRKRPKESMDAGIVRQAIRRQMQLRMDYADEAGAVTQCPVWPFPLGYWGEVELICAWCELRRGFRHFRTDRVRAAQTLGRFPERVGRLRRRWEQDSRSAIERAGYTQTTHRSSQRRLTHATSMPAHGWLRPDPANRVSHDLTPRRCVGTGFHGDLSRPAGGLPYAHGLVVTNLLDGAIKIAPGLHETRGVAGAVLRDDAGIVPAKLENACRIPAAGLRDAGGIAAPLLADGSIVPGALRPGG
ncbi:MAG: WYL domain-containing protein [Hyphomonas sp.]